MLEHIIRTDVGNERYINEDSAWSLSFYSEEEFNTVHKAIFKGEAVRIEPFISIKDKTPRLIFELYNRMILRSYLHKIPKSVNGMVFLGVADGMGGHKSGEIASKMTTMMMCKRFARYALYEESVSYESILKRIIMATGEEVYNKTSEEEGKMGSTICCASVVGDVAFFGNVGDSRGYILRKDGLEQITKDHSFVQELVDAGAISKEDVFGHPQKGIITQSIGGTLDLEPDIFPIKLEDGDIILICSDGVHDMLRHEEIETSMGDVGPNIEHLAKILIDRSNDAGGEDNITVALGIYKKGR